MEGEANLGTAKLLASHEKKFHIYLKDGPGRENRGGREGRSLSFI